MIATARSERDAAVARQAGADHVVVTTGLAPDEVVERVRTHAADGVDHVVEVAFHANIAADERLLRVGGSVAAYATGDPVPTIPFWPLVFKNARLYFLGSDDFPADAKAAAARALNDLLAAGWPEFTVAARVPLESIAEAHTLVESGRAPGRVVLTV